MRDILYMSDRESRFWARLLMGVTLAGSLLALWACTPAQQAQFTAQAAGVSAELQSACALALPLAQMATPIPTIGPFVATGVTVGCGTAQGLAKLAADPTSAAWVGEQMQMLKQALGQKG